MNKTNAIIILKKKLNGRQISPSAIQEFVRICNFWTEEFAKHIGNQPKLVVKGETQHRLYGMNVKEAFADFILRGER